MELEGMATDRQTHDQNFLERKFVWGNWSGVEADDKRHYSSFFIDKDEYRMRECVYLQNEDKIDSPHLGMIEDAWELKETGEQQINVRWFIRPSELSASNEIWPELEDNELFLAYGKGPGVCNVNAWMPIIKKAKVLFMVDHSDYFPAREKYLAQADHFCRSVYDVDSEQLLDADVVLEELPDLFSKPDWLTVPPLVFGASFSSSDVSQRSPQHTANNRNPSPGAAAPAIPVGEEGGKRQAEEPADSQPDAKKQKSRPKGTSSTLDVSADKKGDGQVVSLPEGEAQPMDGVVLSDKGKSLDAATGRKRKEGEEVSGLSKGKGMQKPEKGTSKLPFLPSGFDKQRPKPLFKTDSRTVGDNSNAVPSPRDNEPSPRLGLKRLMKKSTSIKSQESDKDFGGPAGKAKEGLCHATGKGMAQEDVSRQVPRKDTGGADAHTKEKAVFGKGILKSRPSGGEPSNVAASGGTGGRAVPGSSRGLKRDRISYEGPSTSAAEGRGKSLPHGGKEVDDRRRSGQGISEKSKGDRASEKPNGKRSVDWGAKEKVVMQGQLQMSSLGGKGREIKQGPGNNVGRAEGDSTGINKVKVQNRVNTSRKESQGPSLGSKPSKAFEKGRAERGPNRLNNRAAADAVPLPKEMAIGGVKPQDASKAVSNPGSDALRAGVARKGGTSTEAKLREPEGTPLRVDAKSGDYEGRDQKGQYLAAGEPSTSEDKTKIRAALAVTQNPEAEIRRRKDIENKWGKATPKETRGGNAFDKGDKVLGAQGPTSRKQVGIKQVQVKADRKNLFKYQWEEHVSLGFHRERILQLHNLDPTLTSAELQEILDNLFPQMVDKARMMPGKFHVRGNSGSAVVIMDSREKTIEVHNKLMNQVLLLGEDERPVVPVIPERPKPADKTPFYGHMQLSGSVWRHNSYANDHRMAVATSHSSQPNTIEFEMGVSWRLLHELHSLMLTELLKVQAGQRKSGKAAIKEAVKGRKE